MPGHGFCEVVDATIAPKGVALLADNQTVLVRGEQWAHPYSADESAVVPSGYRIHADRKTVLTYLTDIGMSLIVEVQIGRPRSNAEIGGYRTPRSRIYLVDAGDLVTSR
jgi:hypothetical protein